VTRCLGYQYLYISIGAGLVRGEHGMRIMLHAVIPCLVRMHSLDCTTSTSNSSSYFHLISFFKPRHCTNTTLRPFAIGFHW